MLVYVLLDFCLSNVFVFVSYFVLVQSLSNSGFGVMLVIAVVLWVRHGAG